MVDISKVRDLALIVLAMLFLPHQSRTLLFGTQPHDWYGEFAIEGEAEVFVIAKNSSSEKIDTNISEVNMHLTQHLESAFAHEQGEASEIPPLSYSLMSVNSDEFSQRKFVKASTGRIFKPSGLTVETQSDQYITFIMILIVVVAFAGLAFFLRPLH